MPSMPMLATAWTFAFGLPMASGQEFSGPVTGPSTAFTPRAEVAPDRALEPGAVADNTQQASRLPVQLGLTLAGYYDDNIYIRPAGADRVGDFIWTVAPVVSWNSAAQTGLESSVQVSYSPAFVFYQQNPRNNTVEQSGSFVYAFHGPRSDLVVSQQYASVENSAPDLGDLVKQQEYLTTINLDYQLASKLGLTLRALQDIIDYDDGFDSTQWTGSAYLNYQALAKTSVGLGGLFGAADLEGPNQTFEQINGRVLYNPSAKLSLNATGGAEFRQTQGRNRTQVNPMFSLGLSYNPFDSTSLILNAYREYNYSARVFGDDYLATGVSGSVSQRFFQKVYLTFSASFENAQYEDNLSGESSGLQYNFFSVRSALDYKVQDWCDLGIYYQYRQNISHTLNAFTDNQAGFQSRFVY